MTPRARLLSLAALAIPSVNLTLSGINAYTCRRRGDVPADVAQRVVVCIPARNEQSRIAALLTDLRAQTGIADLAVRVLDDASTDSTYETACRAIDGDARFEVRRSTLVPPAGWIGKSFALHRLTDPLVQQCPDNTALVFLDADVRLAANALATALALRRRLRTAERVGLLSIWPTQEVSGVLSALLQPLLAWSWLTSVPLEFSERHPSMSTAVAVGQFLIVDVGTYRAIGGHEAVRDNPVDDLALARVVRAHGYTSVVRPLPGLVRCRMYDTAAQTWQGHRRWLVSAFGGRAVAAIAGAIAVAVYVGPVVGLGFRRLRVVSASALALSAGARLVARHTESATLTPGDIASAAAHPAAIGVAAGILVDALVRRTHTWRGREVTVVRRGPPLRGETAP